MADKEKETVSTNQQPQIVYVQQPMNMQAEDEVEIDLGKVMSIFWEKRALAAKLSVVDTLVVSPRNRTPFRSVC